MNRLAIAILAIASVGLSGCYNTATPEGVVRSAYKALQKNDVKRFPKFLTGEAKLQHGNLKGMAELQERLAEFAKVDLGAVDLVDTVKNGNKDWNRTFSVAIMATESEGGAYAEVMTATVSCAVRYHYEHAGDCFGGGFYGPGYGPGYGGPYYPGHPWGGCHASTWERETMNCRISKLD